MYEHEAMLKQAAQQQAEAQKAHESGCVPMAAQQAHPYSGDTQCSGVAAGRLGDRFGYEIYHAQNRIENMKRASDILTRHPEFEELLWLIRSGLV